MKEEFFNHGGTGDTERNFLTTKGNNMNTENQNTQSKPDGQALSGPGGSRFHYDSESGYIYDQREHEWITDLVEAWELLETYADWICNECSRRDRGCPVVGVVADYARSCIHTPKRSTAPERGQAR
jgi:hypothetical protein